MDRDLVRRIAALLLYGGAFLSSFLVLRVGSFTIGDALLIMSLLVSFLIQRGDGVASAKAISTAQMTVAIMLITLGGAISTMHAIQGAQSLVTLGRLLFLVWLLPGQIERTLTTPAQLRLLFLAFVLGAGISAGASILPAVFHITIPGAGMTDSGRFSGATGIDSDAGCLAAEATTIGILAFLARSRPDHLGRTFSLSLAFLGGIGLVLSGSVSGFISCLLAILVGAYTLRLNPLRFLGVVAVVLLVIFFGTAVQKNTRALTPTERIEQALGLVNRGRYNTAQARTQTYTAALKRVAADPIIGTGLDPRSGAVSATDGSPINDAIRADPSFSGLGVHNFVLAALYGGGVLLAAGILIPIVIGLSRARVATGDDLLPPLALSLFIAATVFGFTAPSFYNRYFWLPLAMWLIVSRRSAVVAAEKLADAERLRKLTEPALPTVQVAGASRRPGLHSGRLSEGDLLEVTMVRNGFDADIPRGGWDFDVPHDYSGQMTSGQMTPVAGAANEQHD